MDFELTDDQQSIQRAVAEGTAVPEARRSS